MVCSSGIPPPAEYIRQVNTMISWFIWRGEIFRGPLSTLQRGKMDRDLVNVWAKSSALFIYRIQAQSQRDGSLTAGRLKKWNLHSRTENPSLPDRIPASMEYLCSYVVDVAYTPRQGRPESAMAYKKWLYTALQTIHNASFTPQEMRIARMWPQSDWQIIWKKITTAPISEAKLCGTGRYKTSSRRMRVSVEKVNQCGN